MIEEKIPAVFDKLYQNRIPQSDHLEQIKAIAWQECCQQGLPSRKQEAWKYTRLDRLHKLDFDAAQAVKAADCDHETVIKTIDQYKIENAVCFVFIDGLFYQQYSDVWNDNELSIELLSKASLSTDNFAPSVVQNPDQVTSNLNLALAEEGLLITTKPNQNNDQLLQCLYLASNGSISHYRHCFNLAVNSKLELMEISASLPAANGNTTDQTGLTSVITELNLAAGAQLDHYKLSCEASGHHHIAGLYAQQDRDSVLNLHHAAVGAELMRYDLKVQLQGTGAACSLNGVYLPNQAQHIDHTIVIEHNADHTRSEQHFKGVLNDRGHGVFNGRVVAQENTKQIVAHQLNHNLLLSSQAEVDTQPQLEIYTDEVECSHGATVGKLDEKALFYLKSRGIDEAQAKQMLVDAFVSDVVSRIDNEAVYQQMQSAVRQKMDQTKLGIE